MRNLPTDRSFGTIFLRGFCSFAILFILDTLEMQKDLNTIVSPYTRKRANFMFFGWKSYKIMNEELARRGIDFHVKAGLLSVYGSYGKAVQALNLLCADYNEKGC